MTVETKEKTSDRQAWMGLLARVEAAELARHWARYGAAPAHDLLLVLIHISELTRPD